MQATQDLNHTRFIMWVNEFEDLTNNAEVGTFMKNFQPYVQLRRVRWNKLITNTPFDNHPYFSNLPVLQQTLPKAAVADLLRLLLGYKFGGVWVRSRHRVCVYTTAPCCRLTTTWWCCGIGGRCWSM